jgi:hypothetical protein
LTSRPSELLRRDMTRESPEFGGQPLWANLSHEARQHLCRLIDWLAGTRPDVYTAFAAEDDLAVRHLRVQHV